MKRIFVFLLAVWMTVSLFSCTPEVLEPTAGTTEKTTEETGLENPSSEAECYPAVSDPLTWEKINAIPIANGEMTVDQLRQICVDYMRLELSFQWTPNETMKYVIRGAGQVR